jgi:DNA repair photolyase
MVDRSKLSPDQPVVRGADVIYPPTGNAGEYAALATNPYVGCGHRCLYCYVPLAMHIGRDEFNKPGVLRDGYLERLRVDAPRHRQALGAGHPADQVFITFSSDPWHPGDCSPTRDVLGTLIENGLAFCTLTKSGAKGLRDADLFRPSRDAFAATMTSLDDGFSRKWEPSAALPAERMAGLRAFRERGIFTWMSLEPTINVEHSLAVVEATHPFVDLYKVGKANYLKKITTETDWRGYTLRIIDRLQALGKAHYVKRDLQAYLPPGYPNPLRVQQHH